MMRRARDIFRGAGKDTRFARVRQNGSHRKLESLNGYPPLGFSYHDGVTVGPGAVKRILVDDVGLGKQEALDLF